MLTTPERMRHRALLSVLDLLSAIRVYHDSDKLTRPMAWCANCGQLLYSDDCPRCTEGKKLN